MTKIKPTTKRMRKQKKDIVKFKINKKDIWNNVVF